MPAKRRYELILGGHFAWKIFLRGKVYWADGRSGSISVGRHSLKVRTKEEAKVVLRRLDERIAVERGLVERERVTEDINRQLPLEDGFAIYRRHMDRPEVSRGIRISTKKRYRPVFAHFREFCQPLRVHHWNQVNKNVVLNYGSFLEARGYAPRTVYLELTTIKQILKYLIDEGHLLPTQSFRLRLSKPTSSDVHCYSLEEVQAILEFVGSRRRMAWLHRILMGLAFTGLRVQELASLKWSDISSDCSTIHLKDEGHRSGAGGDRRRTKSGRSRVLPVLPELKVLLQSFARNPGHFVFQSVKGCRLNDNNLRTVFVNEVIKPLSRQFPSAEGERGFKGARLHSFRHFFCSQMANANTPIAALQQWLGHRNSAMVMHYYHLNNADAKRLMSSIRLLPRPSRKGPGGG